MATEKNITPSPVTVMLTEAQARALETKIINGVNTAGEDLLKYRDLEGWKVRGYKSFKDACEKAFKEIYGGRSQVYRLMQQAEISNEVGEPVSPKTSLALAKAPAGKRQAALEIAKEESGQAKPPVAAVEAAVSKVTTPPASTGKPAAAPAAAGSSEPASAGASVPLRGTSSGASSKPAARKSPAAAGPAAKKDAPVKVDLAIERIGKVIGPAVAKNIKSGTLNNVNNAGALFWADLSDDDMHAIQELVVAKRWDPKKAHKFVSKMPDEKTKIGDLITLATAAGGHVAVTTGGFSTITINTRKLAEEWAKIKKVLGIK